MRSAVTVLLMIVLLSVSGRAARGDDHGRSRSAPLSDRDVDREVGILRARLARRVAEETPFSPAAVDEIVRSGRKALRRDGSAIEASGRPGIVHLKTHGRVLMVRDDDVISTTTSGYRNAHFTDQAKGVFALVSDPGGEIYSVMLAPSVFVVSESGGVARLVSTRSGASVDLDLHAGEADRLEVAFKRKRDLTELPKALTGKLARVGLTIHPDGGHSVAPGADRRFIYRMPSARARGGMVRAGRAKAARARR